MIRSIILTLLLITPAIAFAQVNAGGCASVEGQKLNFLLGEWKVTSRFRLSKEPEHWEETQARSKITSLFDNCLLVEQFEGKRQGHPFKATGMYAYDRNSKTHQWMGVDSEHGVLTLYSGELSGNDLVLESKVEISGQTVLLRRVWTLRATGGFEVRSQRSTDAGHTWDTTWHMMYQR
jgi:hypothetical protein